MADDSKIAAQIEDLILQADNPKDKAFLLILNKIAGNLEENTKLTRELSADLAIHRSEFKTHEVKEMELINQGRGWMRASIFFLGLFQAVAFYFGSSFLSDHSALEKRVEGIAQYIETHKEHHRLEERAKDALKEAK